MSMNRKPTESEKKKTKKLICSSSEELGLVLSNADDIQSRHSYNKYIFKYESLFSDIPLELIVETSFIRKYILSRLMQLEALLESFVKNVELNYRFLLRKL